MKQTHTKQGRSPTQAIEYECTVHAPARGASKAQALLRLNNGSPCPLQFHHSPTGATQSEPECVLCDLPVWKYLCENVSGHVICWAVLQVNEPPLYHIPNEVVVDVNVLRAHMIVIILHKLECCLVVAVECH